MLQRMTLEQLHGDKRTPLEFSDVVNCANTWMIQRGCRARFTPESLDRLRVLRNVFRKEFQRYIAAKPRVFRFIDYAHASAADFFEDGIVGDSATDNRPSVRHWAWSLLQRSNAGKPAANGDGALLAGVECIQLICGPLPKNPNVRCDFLWSAAILFGVPCVTIRKGQTCASVLSLPLDLWPFCSQRFAPSPAGRNPAPQPFSRANRPATQSGSVSGRIPPSVPTHCPSMCRKVRGR